MLAGKDTDGVVFDGDAGVLDTILSLLSLTDEPNPSFDIVTP